MSKIKNLFYKQGNFRLHIPQQEVPDGGTILLTGSSGSGKSTFFNVLSGLLNCPDLIWEFKGQNLARLEAPQRDINYCFQDLRLFPLMTARENIFFALRAKKIPIQKKQKEFEEIIETLNLNRCLSLSLDKLSGGEKQRTALARALISPCRILFLDEPFSYLDKANKKGARDLVQSYVKKKSIPLFLASHEKETDISHQITLKEGCIEDNETI